MYPRFYWICYKTVTSCRKNSDKILQFFYIVEPIFHVVRLYVMTKTNGRMPERMITSTTCHDEPKFLFELGELWHRVWFYVTYNINAMDINVRHEKMTIWYWTNIPYPTYTCGQDSTHIYNCIYIAFCIKMRVLDTYDTHVVIAKMLYNPNTQQNH